MKLYRITENKYPKWIKYNSHKNNLPIWQSVNNQEEETKFLTELRADGYKPFIDKKEKEQRQIIIKGRMKNNVFKIEQIDTISKMVLDEIIIFEKKNKINTLKFINNNFFVQSIGLNNIIESLEKRNVDVKQIFEL